MDYEQEIKRDTDIISKDLLQRPIRARVQIELFRQYFATLFTDHGMNRADLLTKWIEIAGGPRAEVELIDEKGNVIEIVPGIIDGMPSRTGHVVSEIMAKHRLLLASRPPVVAQNYLAGAFREVSESFKRDGATLTKRFDKVKALVGDNCDVTNTLDTFTDTGDGLDF